MRQKNRRLLVFQHLQVEHPGIFRDFMHEKGIEWEVVELNKGDAIPSLTEYDGLWVMGGPMDVWEEEQYPWLKREKAAIREAVGDRQLPFLGVCLGHQLCADALGGEVGFSLVPEVGIHEVKKTDVGRRCAFLGDLPSVMPCLQWHAAEIRKPPPGASVLASSPDCRIQALSYSKNAFSTQYHTEISATTITEWASVPIYRAAMEKSLGPGALRRLEAQTNEHLQVLNRTARLLFDNWCTIAFG